MKKSLAFTLAEVLITLGIIGIVAAMTIPTLINNYQKKITVTRLKQTYAVLWQAIKLSEAENGEINTWNIPSPEDGDILENSNDAYKISESFANQYILPYIKYAYVCSKNAYECTSKKSYCLNGTTWAYNNYGWIYRVMLSNGIVLHIWPRGRVFNGIEFYVDINGASSPNTLGKDIFCMHLRKGAKAGLYFYGEGGTREQLKSTGSYPCAKTGELAGVFCGALIKLDGWEIKDDYPW